MRWRGGKVPRKKAPAGGEEGAELGLLRQKEGADDGERQSGRLNADGPRQHNQHDFLEQLLYSALLTAD